MLSDRLARDLYTEICLIPLIDPHSHINPHAAAAKSLAASPTPDGVPNAHALGLVIYTDYFYAFQVSGLILLVAMIGAIALTLRHRDNIKRQDVLTQIYRTREEAAELVDVKPGQGI